MSELQAAKHRRIVHSTQEDGRILVQELDGALEASQPSASACQAPMSSGGNMWKTIAWDSPSICKDV
jgi:hypothetical protein